MSGTGVAYRDLLPVPEKTHAIDNPDEHEEEHALADGPTASHQLATAVQSADDEAGRPLGLAQENPTEAEVQDLGWNERKENIPAPLVGGMGNEELWMLIRRFNKQIYYVKQTTSPVPGNLDLNIADEDEFSPDKLRSTVERLYMTVIIGVIGFGKHIARLRSWRETRRTAAFAGVYFLAWLLDLLIPTIAGMLVALIAYPPSRAVLFPPAPIALVDGKTGGLQKPKAGVLGSHDSATGAPENHKGEAVEAEAQNFVNGMAHVALSSATGKHPQSEPPAGESPTVNDAIPDPTAIAVAGSNARVNSSAGAAGRTEGDVDKTKVPMQTAMWNQLRPIMHTVADIADTWERFANALSPTAPFPQEATRLRIAGLVIPLLAVSIVTTSYMFVKGTTFAIGFGFFGDPVIARGIDFLNTKYPNWQKLLELRNTVLKGVPTNAQLTITLLRLGEANKAPLPPPPRVKEAPPDEAAERTSDDLSSTGSDAPLGATQEEIDEAASHDPVAAGTAAANGKDIAHSKEHKHGRKGSKIIGFFKGSVKASVETSVGADRVKATVGSSAAKNRVGVIPRKDLTEITSGPVDFKARYHGRKGHVYISTKATIPCVAFTTDSTVEKIGSQDREDLHPSWSIAVADISEVKKVGGFGWKWKLVVGWALERQVADGIEITTKRGETFKITAMPLRDELFNRVIAMAGQKWVLW